jgi:protease-4
MKKFLIGVVAGVVFSGLVVVVLMLAAVRLGDRKPEVPAQAVLTLRLEGALPERAQAEIPIPFFGQRRAVTVTDVWSSLKKAAADERIRAVVLEPRGVQAGWARLDEVRASLLAFRKSGKPVYAHLVTPGARDYYLATAADRIWASPEDILDVKGLRAEMMFFRKTLDKLGIQMEVQHVGKYKDAGDIYTRSDASPETLAVMNAVLDGIYGQLVNGIAEGRKRKPDEVRALLDNGPYTARQAKSAGLVDDLLFEDQVQDEVKKKAGKDARRVSLGDYARVPAPGAAKARKSIALVVGEGTILRGTGDSMTDDGYLAATAFIKTLRQVRDDGSIKGVVLRINSPGGDAIASDDMLREVKLLSKKKPVVISMSDLAASGGYYIAATGDPVVAYPTTLTGSIGVVYSKPNLKGLYDKIGITKQLLTRGRFADLDSDYPPMNEASRKKLAESMDEVYRAFVGHVSEARKRKVEEIEPLAQGRVWLGAQARANGLVDELGGLDKAMEMVKKRAGIPAAERVRVVSYPAKKTLLEKLLERSMETRIDPRVDELVRSLELPLWSRGGMMKVMPYRIDIE